MFERVSNRQVGYYLVNGFLFGVVVLSWTYTILAGKVVSERYLQKLDLTLFYRAATETSRENP